MTEPLPSGAEPQPAAPHRGSHRAPAKPQRMIGLSLIAIAAVVALLVAFSSCGGGFDSGAGVINGTPGVTAATTPVPTTTAPPTTPASTTPAPVPTTAPPTTTAPATTAAPTTAPATTAVPATAARIPVIVLNGTTTNGLAARAATFVKSAGWTVSSTGNWRGSKVSTTTIFYGSGDQAAAQRLARELSGDQEVRPALSGMSTSRLTLVVG